MHLRNPAPPGLRLAGGDSQLAFDDGQELHGWQPRLPAGAQSESYFLRRLRNGASGRTGMTGDGSHPTDMAQSGDGRFLYQSEQWQRNDHVFRVKSDGSFKPLIVVSGIPTSAAGLAGR